MRSAADQRSLASGHISMIVFERSGGLSVRTSVASSGGGGGGEGAGGSAGDGTMGSTRQQSVHVLGHIA